MRTRVKDTIRIRGDLEIVIRHADTGRLYRREAIRNQITYEGLNSVIYLWSQDTGSPTDWQIAQLIPGTNNTPPTRGDVGLGAPLPSPSDHITLSAANRTPSPTTGELIITATLGTGQANGFTLCEVGLFFGNNSMGMRQIHSPFPKTISFTVGYTWRLAAET